MTPTDKLRAKIAEQDAARGRPLTDAEKLANLKASLSRCDKCEKPVQMNDRYCPWCSYDLMGEDQ